MLYMYICNLYLDANSLVWKTDLNAELRLRAAQRQEQATKRVADLANDEDDAPSDDDEKEEDSDLHSNSNSNSNSDALL